MNLQGSINNLLSTVAVASRLGPGYEAREAKARATAAAETKIAGATKRLEKIPEGIEAGETGTLNIEKKAAQEDIVAGKKALFDIDPTDARLQEYLDASGLTGATEAHYEFRAYPEEIEQEQAELRAAEAEAERAAAARVREAELRRIGETILEVAPQTYGKVRDK